MRRLTCLFLDDLLDVLPHLHGVGAALLALATGGLADAWGLERHIGLHVVCTGKINSSSVNLVSLCA